MVKSFSFILLCVVLFNGCVVPNDSKHSNVPSDSANDFKRGIVPPDDYEDSVGDTLTVLSWNVEHFIDTHDNPYTQNKRENEGERMEERIHLFVKALRTINADIVVLQEFEHVQFLKQIASDSLSTMGYQFFADHESINWYMNVVVMSRVPLGILYGYGSVTTSVQYVDEKTGEERSETQSMINTRMWSVDVLVNDHYSFLLTGVHLKAGRGNRNVAMRLGQIQFLKGQFERFLKENNQKNIVIVGDFNATPDSEELKVMLDGDSPALFVDPLPDSVFSHPADNPKWRIDHILPNVNMYPELVDGTPKVMYVFDKETQEKLADHLPLIAKFITRDVKSKD